MTRAYATRPLAMIAAAALAGCSTAPRDFTPTVASPAAATANAYEADLADCKAQVASGRRSDFNSGRTTSVVAGSAVGVGAGLATGASAASGMGMMAGTAGAAGMAVGFVVAAPLGVVVVSRSIRAHKEREIKTATATCLQERGYTVTNWARTRKGSVAAAGR